MPAALSIAADASRAAAQGQEDDPVFDRRVRVRGEPIPRRRSRHLSARKVDCQPQGPRMHEARVGIVRIQRDRALQEQYRGECLARADEDLGRERHRGHMHAIVRQRLEAGLLRVAQLVGLPELERPLEGPVGRRWRAHVRPTRERTASAPALA